MLYPPEDTEVVKHWLIRELGPLCDADPDVLADYVLALFKNDSNEVELTHMLNEQLADFLEQHTAAFVDKAVSTLRDRTYVGAGQTRKREDEDEGGDGDDGVHDGADDAEFQDASDQPAKRQAYEQESMDAEDESNSHSGMQSRPRRGGRIPKGLSRDNYGQNMISRGPSRKFQHGDDSMMGGMPQLPFPIPPGMPPMPFMPPGMPPGMPPMPMPTPEHFAQMMQQMQQQMGGPFGRGGRGGRGRGGSSRGGRGRGGHGSAPPVARSQDTLVIENIPQENLDLVHVNDYFKRFGTITNIEIDEPGKKAVVSYATPAEAEQAHKSPDVIFGNRFVKVYFQRIERPPPAKPNYMTDKGSNVYLAPELRSATSATMTPAEEERHRVLELRKKRQTLVHMQLAEQKALLQKLESKDLTPQGRNSIMSMLEKLSGEIKGATEMLKKDMQPASESMDTEATTEELQAKLAHLKEEAASLGIDTAQPPAMRGAFRGRGYNPSFRARGRGRGRGATFMPRASMTLDNRTTKVGIANLPAGYDAARLQEHVQQFGEINAMEHHDDHVIVTYKTRVSGERAMRAGGSIPDVGNATLKWVETPAASTPTQPPQAASTSLDTAEVADLEDSERENWKR